MEGVRGATARAAAAAARAAGLELGLEDVAVAEAAGDGPVEGAPQLHQVVLRAIKLVDGVYLRDAFTCVVGYLSAPRCRLHGTAQLKGDHSSIRLFCP